ncbi:MAG: phosphoribosyl-AMP cyclohydrolase [Spirochaetia bacterium]|nr:phosphoribosyl-AMP cyclohydrolase [Spirochaetia bacterium]
MNSLEEDENLRLDFEKVKKALLKYENIIPVIVQDVKTLQVLILAYVNETALQKSLSSGVATFWSTSRNELWIKGATSGQYLDIREVRVNCEQNSLLFLVEIREEGACHTKNSVGKHRYSCYYRYIEDGKLKFVKGLK